MMRVADSWTSDLGSVLGQVFRIFVNFILLNYEKNLECVEEDVIAI